MSLLDALLGRPLANSEEEQEKIGVLSGVPILGLDGLSSAAYGPEAALTILLPLGALGLNYIGPITLVILILLGILYFSYRQTIAAYPTGGGSYTVARENLGERAGLLAAAALMLDYILNVAVGISAGVGALVSAVPSLHSHILELCLVTLVLITIVNLRGLRESGLAFGLPTYLFVGTLLGVVATGLVKTITSGGHPAPVADLPSLPAATEAVSFWILMRAFASGCTAMTGVEAVSNGVTAFAKPAIRNARLTLTTIVIILATLLAGVAYTSRAYGIGAMEQEQSGYQSIISQLAGAVFGRGVLYYITLGSVLTVLALSANTSFAGFPRLCQLIAQDDYLPRAFTTKGRRLVYSVGIVILASLSGLLLILFGGITDRLIPLFAVGAFGAFTLSQAGMVLHWKRIGGRRSHVGLAINGIGAVATCLALVVIMVAKFSEGAWITVVLVPTMLLLFVGVRRHYRSVSEQIRCVDPLDLSHREQPIVVVPIAGWTMLAQRAIQFGFVLSSDLRAVHITHDEQGNEGLRRQWTEKVEVPSRAAGLPPPQLDIIYSPYRLLTEPLLEYVDRLKEENPSRLVAVIIPELVEARWYQYLMHNQRATWLKTALLLRGDRRVIIVNVPWYLRRDQP